MVGMKKRYLLITAVMQLTALYGHYLTLEGDALYLGRDLTDSNQVAQFDLNTTTGYYQQFLTTKDVAKEMNHEVALQAKGTIIPTKRETLEFRYTGLLSFKGKREVSEDAGIRFPFVNVDSYDWEAADRMKALYDSNYYSFDCTYFHYMTPIGRTYFSFDWGLGVNFTEINEQFKLRYYTDDRSSKYDIKTQNRLLGGFALLELAAHPMRIFTWGIQLRGGLDANIVGVQKTLFDNNDTVMIMNSAQRKIQLSYMGIIDPYLVFAPTQTFNIVFGYTWIYYEDVALAPEQIDYEPSTLNSVYAQGHENYRGFYGGIRLNF